jgi:hypothetical protein
MRFMEMDNLGLQRCHQILICTIFRGDMGHKLKIDVDILSIWKIYLLDTPRTGLIEEIGKVFVSNLVLGWGQPAKKMASSYEQIFISFELTLSIYYIVA